MSKGISFSPMDGSKLRIGVVVSRWNHDITRLLLAGCTRAFSEAKVPEKNMTILEVPGAFELPTGARHLIEAKKIDVVICLGCLVKGDTRHDEYIAHAVADGIMALSLDTGVPVIFGVLTCQTEAQAVARVTGDNNHGYLWGNSAVEMGLLRRQG